MFVFWTILCFVTIIWYIIVTAIVAYRGAKDIKNMIESLKEKGYEKMKDNNNVV
jgi:hypothetical protein